MLCERQTINSLPCYCYETKSDSRTMRSQVSQQRESADERVDTSELQAHPRLPYWRFSCQIAQIWRFLRHLA